MEEECNSIEQSDKTKKLISKSSPIKLILKSTTINVELTSKLTIKPGKIKSATFHIKKSGYNKCAETTITIFFTVNE